MPLDGCGEFVTKAVRISLIFTFYNGNTVTLFEIMRVAVILDRLFPTQPLPCDMKQETIEP